MQFFPCVQLGRIVITLYKYALTSTLNNHSLLHSEKVRNGREGERKEESKREEKRESGRGGRKRERKK